MKIWRRGNTSKMIMVALVVALVLSVVFSAIYLIPKYRTLDKYAYEGQNPVDAAINKASDQLIIPIVVSEFRISSDGAYPSPEYIMETIGPDYPLHLEKVEIKDEAHNPSTTAWPAFKTLHVWPGYSCTVVAEGRRFTADEIEYKNTLERNDETFALISAEVFGLLIDPESGAPIKKEADRNPTYTCSEGP